MSSTSEIQIEQRSSAPRTAQTITFIIIFQSITFITAVVALVAAIAYTPSATDAVASRECANFTGRWEARSSSPMRSAVLRVTHDVYDDGNPPNVSYSEPRWLLRLDLKPAETDECMLQGTNACVPATFDEQSGEWVATGPYTPHPVVGVVTGTTASLLQLPTIEATGLVNANIKLELTGSDEAAWSIVGTGVGGSLAGLEQDIVLAARVTAHRVPIF